MLTSVTGVSIVVTADAVLFAVFGSVSFPSTDRSFVIVPGDDGAVTSRVATACASAARSSMVQMTDDPLCMQAEDAATNVTPEATCP